MVAAKEARSLLLDIRGVPEVCTDARTEIGFVARLAFLLVVIIAAAAPSETGQQSNSLIGDAINDYHAAQENLITFFGYNNLKLKKLDKYFEI